MSEFDNTPVPETASATGEIDFSCAERLPGGGSTCEVFLATYHLRRVFVKKLRDEFAFSPEHRAAFAKEYETGVRLNHHRSLPVYYDFHSEPPVYILMDYIDGDTLADLADSDDPRLADESHVRQILGELVDVVDFLHQHNVVHCDIKGDNVMLTRGARNVMLIDLDKCYTDWLCFASGKPEKFGLCAADRGSVTLDFHGIAKILELLEDKVSGFPSKKFRKFHDKCLEPDVTPEQLRATLRPCRKTVPAAIAAAVALIAAIGGVDYLNTGVDTTPAPGYVAQSAAPSYLQEIDSLMPFRLAPLHKKINEGMRMLDDSSATDRQVYLLMNEIIELNSAITLDAMAEFKTKYPDVNSVEMEMAVTGCGAYSEATDAVADFTARVAGRMTSSDNSD